MAKQKKTKPTLTGIAAGLDALGERIEKKIEDKVDELARITAGNFLRVEENFSGLKDDVSSLKDGQERIELRLTNVAYRFEFKELESKTKVLEDKLDIRRK